jgi:putative ABC transport system ATP-binding protein
MPGWLDRRPRRWLRERVETLLQQLSLQDRTDHRPDQLSGGEQQRVAIARALLLQPPLLLADEPTGNLDAASSEALLRSLRDLARDEGLTVVMVTHEPAAAAWCDEVLVLRDGQRADAFATAQMNAEAIAARVQRGQESS